MQDCTLSLSQDNHLFRHLLSCERAKVLADGEMKERNGSCAEENFSKGQTAPSTVYNCNHNRLRGGSERWAPLSAATNRNADTSAANCQSDEGCKLRVALLLKIMKMSYWHHLSLLCVWNSSPCAKSWRKCFCDEDEDKGVRKVGRWDPKEMRLAPLTPGSTNILEGLRHKCSRAHNDKKPTTFLFYCYNSGLL